MPSTATYQTAIIDIDILVDIDIIKDMDIDIDINKVKDIDIEERMYVYRKILNAVEAREESLYDWQKRWVTSPNARWTRKMDTHS